jgi:hypothetical protein
MCSNLPPYSTCSFSPSTVTFTASTTTVPVTLTITTTGSGSAASSARRISPRPGGDCWISPQFSHLASACYH